MLLLWHLIKTDLRHARWPLLAWSLAHLLVTAVGLSLWYVPSFHIDHPLFAQSAFSVATFVLLFTAYDFGVRIVQADNPCVSHAFWRTRPISPAGLLAAKLLCLLVCSLLAAAPGASIFLTHQLAAGVSLNLLPLFLILLLQLPFLALAVLFATLTPSSRHCLFATIVGLIGFFTWVTVSLNELTDISPNLATSRFYMTAALTAATAAVVIAHQYRTARLHRSLILLGLGLTVALTTPYWWRRPMTYHETIPAETESALTRGIVLRSAHPQLQTEALRRPHLTRLSFHVASSPPPAGYLLHLDSVRQHWPAIGLTTELTQPSDRYLPDQYARAAITGETFNAPSQFEARVVLPSDAAIRLNQVGATRAFTAECTLTLSRPEIACTVSLRNPGHSIVAHPLGRTRIVSLAPAGDSFWVSTLDDPRDTPLQDFSLRLGDLSNSPSAYLLIHRPTGEIVSLIRSRSTSGLAVNLIQFSLADPTAGKPTDARWLEDCDLVQVTPRPIGRFTRRFTNLPKT